MKPKFNLRLKPQPQADAETGKKTRHKSLFHDGEDAKRLEKKELEKAMA